VNDLATELRLTDNAVRAHLASLERDRLVVHSFACRNAHCWPKSRR
jgi:predicted ArsR family transcriptional regulator